MVEIWNSCTRLEHTYRACLLPTETTSWQRSRSSVYCLLKVGQALTLNMLIYFPTYTSTYIHMNIYVYIFLRDHVVFTKCCSDRSCWFGSKFQHLPLCLFDSPLVRSSLANPISKLDNYFCFVSPFSERVEVYCALSSHPSGRPSYYHPQSCTIFRCPNLASARFCSLLPSMFCAMFCGFRFMVFKFLLWSFHFKLMQTTPQTSSQAFHTFLQIYIYLYIIQYIYICPGWIDK